MIVADVDLLLMHNTTFAAEYVHSMLKRIHVPRTNSTPGSPTLYQHESASTSSPVRSSSASR